MSIADGATLRQYLCPDTGTLPPNTHLVLSRPLLVLPNEGPRFCLIENTTNLSISPSQDVLSVGYGYAIVSCNNAEIGFGFFNVAALTVSSVVFRMCGGHPSSEAVKYVNETDQYLYHDSSVPMVLFFSHCYNIKLHNTSVSVHPSDQLLQRRFVVGVNLCGDSEINTVIPVTAGLSLNNTIYTYKMMVLFVYFTDTAFFPHYALCNLHVTTNCSSSLSYGNYVDLKLGGAKVRLDYFGDFILFLTQSFLVNVDLNIGPSSYAQAIQTTVKVVFVNSDTASLVSFQGYNRPYKLCADPNISDSSTFMPMYLQVLFYETPDFISNVTGILGPALQIHDTAFMNTYNVQHDILVLTKITSKLPHLVSLDNVSWCDNHFLFERYSLLWAQNLPKLFLKTPGELLLRLNNILAHNNVVYTNIQTSACLMSFSHIGWISMTGINYFAENGGGTVIKLIGSELIVSGNLTIMDGYAFQGGGISMDYLSILIFQEPLVAGFYNNIADHGSAIYSSGENFKVTICNSIIVWPNKVYSLSNVTSINISLYFRNNTQRSLYAPTFSYHYDICSKTSYSLLFNKSTWDWDHSQYAYTTLFDNILHMDKIDKYTSLWNGVCIQPRHQEWKCGYNDPYEHQKLYNVCTEHALLGSTTIYPGQKAFHVHDLHQCQVTYCLSNFSVEVNSSVVRNKSLLTYTLAYLPQTGGYYVAWIEDDWFGVFKVPLFLFNLTDCPLGFSLSNGSCTCDDIITSHGYSCDIDTETITSPLGYWTGLEKQESGDLLIFDDHCHSNYCDSDKHDFHLNDDPAKDCLGNRTGVLYGECKENYSVVFGSDTCYDHCTDVYLLTIPAYALAGLLLVFLLFTLRITVATGTINGLIFHANVLGLVLDQLTEDRVQSSRYVAFVCVFISLLNLDLGFPLCFYEGMTMAGKVGFQILFPVYLWSIVVMLILLSRCSIRLSELVSKSSMQVLATLFYLSFSKLLSTVIVIFSSTTISVIKGPGNYTSRVVWYYNGHDYGSSTHAILLALAVAFTVLFILPYALLVTFSSHLLRFRIVNNFKPFIDAYGGSFKDRWRFWFGLRILITIFLFGLNGALQGTNTDVMFIVIIITVVSFMFLQHLVRPFKNHFIGAFDLFIMLNYCLLVLFFLWPRDIFWYVYIVMTAIAVLATVVIVLGHLFALSETCRAKCANMLPQERNNYQHQEMIQDNDEDMELFAAAEDRDQDTY